MYVACYNGGVVVVNSAVVGLNVGSQSYDRELQRQRCKNLQRGK
jgi:hypothetical protein